MDKRLLKDDPQQHGMLRSVTSRRASHGKLAHRSLFSPAKSIQSLICFDSPVPQCFLIKHTGPAFAVWRPEGLAGVRRDTLHVELAVVAGPFQRHLTSGSLLRLYSLYLRFSTPLNASRRSQRLEILGQVIDDEQLYVSPAAARNRQ